MHDSLFSTLALLSPDTFNKNYILPITIDITSTHKMLYIFCDLIVHKYVTHVFDAWNSAAKSLDPNRLLVKFRHKNLLISILGLKVRNKMEAMWPKSLTGQLSSSPRLGA